jgi:SAM-dependent methyltransferase
MAAKPETPAGPRRKLKRLFGSEYREQQEAQLKAIREEIGDLRALLGQFISLVSLKQQLPAIPPKGLQVRVAGAYYPTFFDHGRGMFQDIEKFLGSNGLSIYEFKSILDFGCGCGRVLIPMTFLLDPKRLSGTDIDAEAIGWLKRRFTCFQDLDVNGHAPPTKYADGTFDFIYSVSVFTHLPEDMQHAWLKELARLLRPGGHGMFTTHGEKHFHHVREEDRAELLRKGFWYQATAPTDGLPDFYQVSFHTHDYIRREWRRHFEVVAIQKEAIDAHQDAVLVRKKAKC